MEIFGIDILQMIKDVFDAFGGVLENILPTDPFLPFISELEGLPWLPYLNWFLPVSDLLAIFSVWLLSLGVWISISVILRWLKIIEG